MKIVWWTFIKQSYLNVLIISPSRYNYVCFRHVTQDKCGGPPGLQHQAFHILLTDRGCKLTQVQNSTSSFLWHSHQVFPRERQAGRLQLDPAWNVLLPYIAFHFPHCLTAQLTGVIGPTLWEAVFRCISQWSERKREQGGGVTGGNVSRRRRDTLPSAAAPMHKQRESFRESFPTLKQAAHFPFHICFSCQWQI